MNLQELKKLGVRELRISGGQAVAVNPYEWCTLARSGLKRAENRKYLIFQKETFYLPPLPCAESVKEGTYPIGMFSEVEQFRDKKGKGPNTLWENRNNKNWDYVLRLPNLFDTRQVLVLSEPVAESEPENLMTSEDFIKLNNSHDEVDETVYQIEHTKGWSDLRPDEVETYRNSNANIRVKPDRDDVAEKPEGEDWLKPKWDMHLSEQPETDPKRRLEEANALKLLTALNSSEAKPVEDLTVDQAGAIAVRISESIRPELTAQEQALFIAGFQECIKWQVAQALKK